MKRYSKYKPSKVDWIGNVPEHWEILHVKNEILLNKGKNPQKLVDSSESLPPYLSMDYLREREGKYLQYPESGDGLILVNENDLLILWDGANAGEVMLSKNGYLGSTMAIVRIKSKKIKYPYLYYFLKANERLFKEASFGTTIPHFQGESLLKQRYAFPSTSEQLQIASFLDRQTAEIDRVIATREKQMELLNEMRTSIISNAITKGIDRNVKMKPSGMDWIGEVPEHWEKKRIKDVLLINPKINRKIEDQDAVFLPMEAVSIEGEIEQENFMEISNSTGYTIFEKGDIILAKITPCFENGKCALLTNLVTNIGFGSTEFHVIRTKTILPKFAYYILKSNQFMKIGEANMTGAAGQKRVPTDFIKTFPIIIPNISEQKQIASYIDRKITDIAFALEKYNQQIELLKSYKTSLISEVVTGKLDVRQQTIN